MNTLQPVFRLIDSAILAISTVAVFTFVSLGPGLAFPLNISLYCYALCVPLAAMHTLVLMMASDKDVAAGVTNPLSFRTHNLLVSLTAAVFYIGTLALFAYLSWRASVVFALGSSVGYGLLLHMLSPSQRGYKAFVSWGGAVLVFSATILVVGYLLRDKFAVI